VRHRRFDAGWLGGEADLAAFAGAQVVMSVPSFYRLETSRRDLSSHNAFMTEPLDSSDERLKLPRQPGLGIEMNMDFPRGNVVDGYGGSEGGRASALHRRL
jgi:L-alanine-DL-glutamate epimerase-like enolase superfamily enzyme